MKARILIIILALFMGLFAVVGVLVYVGSVRAQVAEDGRMITVLVAEKKIAAGTELDMLLDQDMVSVEKVPKKYIASGVVSSTSQLKGKIANTTIAKGEQLTLFKFDTPQTATSLELRISGDMRAVAIPINDEKGVAGALAPGDRVDVIGTFDKQIAGVDTTKVFLQNIEVLSVAGSGFEPKQSTDEEKPGAVKASSTQSSTTQNSQSNQTSTIKRTVVLAVSASDLEKLIFAEEKGSVVLALVPNSAKTLQTTGQTIQSVFK